MKSIQSGLLAATLFAMLSGHGWAQSAEDAFGVWEHPENGSHIRISRCNGGLCAKIVKVRDPSRTDVNNPDAAKRDRKIKGLTIMQGAKKTGDATWSGKLYNTQDGQVYSGTITVLSENRLKLQGCVLGGLICQGPTWTRIR